MYWPSSPSFGFCRSNCRRFALGSSERARQGHHRFPLPFRPPFGYLAHHHGRTLDLVTEMSCIEFPNDLPRRFLILANGNEITPQLLDKAFDSLSLMLRWQTPLRVEA